MAFRMLLEESDGNLSAGMKLLNSAYAQYFNHSHDRTGHLFQGRFKAIVVDKESYLLELCRYIVLNPVRSGIVESPGDYIWSSYSQKEIAKYSGMHYSTISKIIKNLENYQ